MMKSKNLKNIILIFSILIYVVIYKFIIYTKFLKYNESITAAFSILLLAGSIFLLGYRKNSKKELTNKFIKTMIICVILYFFSTYGIGLVVGFLSNSYSLHPLAIIENAIFILISIVSLEVFRYVFISANKKNNICIFLITILIGILEIILFVRYDSFNTLENTFKFTTLTIIPIVMKNILCSYCTYQTDYKTSLIYRIIMDLYIYIVPIQPDLGDYLNSILMIVLPFIILIYLLRIIDGMNQVKEHDFDKKIIKLSDILVLAFVAIFACFIFGIGPYHIIGIETGSMTPNIKVGDAVLIDKTYNKDKLKEGDIIAYENKDDVLVIHRIIKINSDGTFVTKGDFNNSADSGFVSKSQIKGKIAFKIPYIAYPAVMFKNK